MKLTNILKKLITEVTAMELKDKYYPNVPNELYQKILRLDPTYNEQTDKMGKYTKWLLNKKNLVLFKSIKEEDYYKIREDLSKYDKLKNTKKISPEHSNIDKFDINSLASLMFKTYADTDTQSQNEKAAKAKQSVEKYEAGDFYIIVPKTEEAACYYGKGTRWCTAANENNMFDHYNEDGKLWILINKKDPKEKYQFHFESNQYMNVADKPISPWGFLSEYWEVYDFFVKNGTIKPEVIDNNLEIVETFYQERSRDAIPRDVIISYFNPNDGFDLDLDIPIESRLEDYSNIITDDVLNDLINKAKEQSIVPDEVSIDDFYELVSYIEGTDIEQYLNDVEYYAIESKIYKQAGSLIERSLDTFKEENEITLILTMQKYSDYEGELFVVDSAEIDYHPHISPREFEKYYFEYQN